MISSAFLTRRELDALTLLGRFRFLSRAQLQAFLFGENGRSHTLSAQTKTFRIVNSLAKKQLIQRTSRSVGGQLGGSGAYAVYLTPTGIRSLDDQRFARLPRRLPPRGTFLLRHALTNADVALAFERAARANDGHRLVAFECDWEVALRFGRNLVVPDAFMLYETPLVELHAFVEIDLGTEGSRFFARKVSSYLTHWRGWKDPKNPWPTVLVVTPDGRRTSLLKRTTEMVLAAQADASRAEAETEFAFTSLRLLHQQGALAEIWEIAGRAGPQRLIDDGRPLR